TPLKTDPHTDSRPATARVTHLSWKAVVDFEMRKITATASWQIETGEDAKEIVFDTKGLAVTAVRTNAGPADYTLGKNDPTLGEALTITIGPEVSSVDIEYETSPDAAAVQWLSPEQTADKKHPFLFTQSQAILARSWIPCQDSPGIKFTYDAEVTVPAELLALMSASNPQEKNETGTYRFEMRQPISSYLLALAVGDVEFRPISDRSGVYAEPSMIDKVAWEFAD